MWKQCPRCKALYQTDAGRCPLDGADLTAAADPRVGALVGAHYRLVRPLGYGSTAAVYHARHEASGRDVALKLLDPRYAATAASKTRFLDEARASNLLRHRNIVDVTDSGVDGDNLYLVMELLDGEALHERLARGPGAPAEALEAAIDVASALARAHEADVIHRDIKPANIFLCARSPRVRVLDFGLAQMHRDQKLSITGQIFGTPAYMAPEQVLGERCTPASDLYSLGVTLFEMLTAQMPFTGAVIDVMLDRTRLDAPRVCALSRELTPEVDAVVARLLARAPAARPRDARQVAVELRRALDALPPDAARAEAPLRSD